MVNLRRNPPGCAGCKAKPRLGQVVLGRRAKSTGLQNIGAGLARGGCGLLSALETPPGRLRILGPLRAPSPKVPRLITRPCPSRSGLPAGGCRELGLL
jgi:hypothetical protein